MKLRRFFVLGLGRWLCSHIGYPRERGGNAALAGPFLFEKCPESGHLWSFERPCLVDEVVAIAFGQREVEGRDQSAGLQIIGGDAAGRQGQALPVERRLDERILIVEDDA